MQARFTKPHPPAALPLDRLARLTLRLGRRKTEPMLHATIVGEAARLLRAQRVLLVLNTDKAAPRIAGSKLPAGESAEALLRAVSPWLTEALDTGASRLRHGPPGVDPKHQRSCLVAPLLAPQGPLGCLYADVESPHGRFEDAERAVLGQIAAQAAAAIAHLRAQASLQAQLEQRAAELAVIDSIQQGVAGSLDFQAIVDLVGDRLREVLHSTDMGIFWFDQLTGLMHHLYVYEHGVRLNLPPAQPPDGGSWSTLVRTRRHLLFNTVAEQHAAGVYPHPGTDQDLSLLYVPIIGGDRVLGRIHVASFEREHAFGEAEVRLLQTVATSMGLAMENARLFDETRAALQRQTATAEVLQVISHSVADAQPVLEKILESCHHLIDAQGLAIGLVGEDGRLHLAATRSYGVDGSPGWSQAEVEARDERMRSAFPMALEGTGTARAIATGRVLNFPDVLHGADVPHRVRESVAASGTNCSQMMAPLMQGERGIGAIGLQRAALGGFTAQEQALLMTFADQAVIAIQNATMFRETKEALEQQTASTEVLQVINASPGEIGPVFDAIAGKARQLCAADMGGLYVVEGDMATAHGNDSLPDTYLSRAMARRVPVKEIYGSGTDDRPYLHIRDLRETRAYHERWPTTVEGVELAGVRTSLMVPLRDGDRLVGLFALNRAVARRAAELCEADWARLWLVSDASLREAAHCLRDAQRSPSEHEGELEMPLRSASPSARAATSGTVVHVEDIVPLLDTEYPDAREMQQRFGFRTLLSVPMLRDGIAIGVIGLNRRDVRPFRPDEIALVQTFASQAVIAIENVRLFNETKEALERQTASAEVLSVISSSVADTAPVFERILDSCQRVIDCTDLNVMTLDDTGVVHWELARGTGARALGLPGPMPVEHTELAQVMIERRAAHYPDALHGDGVPQALRRLARKGQGNFASVVAPMLQEGRVVGGLFVVRVFSEGSTAPFTDKDVRLLQSFADQAVIAIQNARMFRETREALERQTATAEVLNAISNSVSDTAPVFERILASCDRMLGAGSATDITLVLQGEGGLVHHVAGLGPNTEAIRRAFPIRPRATALAAPELRVLHWPDVMNGADVPASTRELALRINAGNYSQLQAQLVWEGEWVGSLNVTRNPPKPFTTDEQVLVKTFADQAVIAIQNARMFRQTQEAREQAEVARRQAEAANEAKSTFLATMSHEIRTPMNGIIGMSGLLLETALNDDQQDLARTLRDSGESLLTIINDILDFSKIEAGKLDVESSPFELRECIGSAAELVKHRAAEKKLGLAVVIADDAPTTVKGDRTRLRQILLNLLSNALKFTEAGEVRLAVERRGADELHFAVQDSGIGLTPEGMAKLFRSFSQADSSTTRKYGGTGLGLVISKRLAEIMGGTMSAQSEGAGQGCTFRFHIRAETVAAQATAAKPGGKAAIDPQMASAHPLRILLAEDNLVNQKLALRLLSQMGYTADVVVNGQLAIDAVERQTYDVVLMDVQMPEMDGLEASRRITAKHKPNERPRIVAMTANAMQGDREACLAAGMDDYVTKPIRVEALVQALLQVPAR